MLGRTWKIGTLLHCWWECKMVQATARPGNSWKGRGSWEREALSNALLRRASAFSSRAARAAAVNWKFQEGVHAPACLQTGLFYPVSSLFGLALLLEVLGGWDGPWPQALTVLPIKASRWRFKLISGYFSDPKTFPWTGLGPRKAGRLPCSQSQLPSAVQDPVSLECGRGAIAAFLVPTEPLGKLSPARPISGLSHLANKNTRCSLAGVARWTECRPARQGVASLVPVGVGLVPGRGVDACLGCGPGSPVQGHAGGNHTLMFLSLSFLLLFPLKTNLKK